MYHPSPLKKLFHSTRRLVAQNWLAQQHALQIALTGSYGKTNTSYVLSQILSTIAPTVFTDLNLDTIYNVPITALKVLPSVKFAIFELGIDHPNEMNQHLKIVKPKIAIVTGISPVHTDKEHLGSIDNVIVEKRKLIEAVPGNGFAILNYDDENVRQMARYTNASILWYGTDENTCDVWVNPKTVAITLDGTIFTVKTVFDQRQSFTMHTHLIGRHQIYTIMAVMTTIIAINKLLKTNISLQVVVRSIKNIYPLRGRMSLDQGPLHTIILNDSLRANPASTIAGLETLYEIPYTGGRKIAVLAEMGELDHEKEEHKKIGSIMGRFKPDYFIGIGPLQKFTVDEALNTGMAQGRAVWVKDVQEAAEVLKQLVRKNDLIYLKGSLLHHVERVLLILENKKVRCTVTLCPFYHYCSKCEYLVSGYQNKDAS